MPSRSAASTLRDCQPAFGPNANTAARTCRQSGAQPALSSADGKFQYFGCRKRARSGGRACSSPDSVPYFLDTVLAGKPEIAPLQRDWRRPHFRNLPFARERVRCPVANCPRNEGKLALRGMRIVLRKPRGIAGYPELGELIKFNCAGTARHPHKLATAYWSLKLGKVVQIPDPNRGKRKLDWWEEPPRTIDACPECGRALQRQKIMRKGALKGFVKKYCPSSAPHKRGKYYYFDPKTGQASKAPIGRRGPDLPAAARNCTGCGGSTLKTAGRCIDHNHCYRMRCVSPTHRRQLGPRNHHWDLAKRIFVTHSRTKPLPPVARKVGRRLCPRCKKPMSWRVRGRSGATRVYFMCPACRRRFGRSWTITVDLHNKELHRGTARA